MWCVFYFLCCSACSLTAENEKPRAARALQEGALAEATEAADGEDADGLGQFDLSGMKKKKKKKTKVRRLYCFWEYT